MKMCFCEDIINQNNKTQLLILQDPEETSHYLNTGIMAKLSFTNIEVILTNKISSPLLEKKVKKFNTPTLLYPETEGSNSSKNIIRTDLLIVLDGTWRKAKRILKLFPFLNDLPRLSITNHFDKKYTLRKSNSELQYSTLEAITYALNKIENKDFSSCLKILEKQIEKQTLFIPNKLE